MIPTPSYKAIVLPTLVIVQSSHLGIEGAGVRLAHVQTGGPRPVCGGVSRTRPAGGLACTYWCQIFPLNVMCVTPLRLVAAMRTLLTLPTVTVIHEA